MTDVVDDEALLHQHSLNVEDLLKDYDFSGDSPLQMSGGLIGQGSIWANNGGSSISGDFMPYGLSNGYHHHGNQWSTYGSRFDDGSPIREDSFTPLSQPESDSSDHSWRFDSMNGGGMDFTKASEEGAQRYAEALSQWSNTNGMYDPFKSSSLIDDLDGVQMGQLSRDKSPLRRSQSANSRPTFADVTKKPSSPGSEPPPTPSLSNEGTVYESQESLNSLQEKKKPKAFRPAHPRHGGYHVPLPINPDSKYGLDDFDTTQDSSAASKLERSFSCNGALGHPHHDSEDNSADDSNSSDPTSLRQTGSSTKSAREWFDPKRIFGSSSSGGTARARSESEPCGGDTILNNNVSARAQTTKANGRRSNASYINNLRDGAHQRSTKQTNADRAKPAAMNGSSSTGSKASSPTSNGDAGTAGVSSSQGSAAQCNGGAAAAAVSPDTSAAGYYVSGGVNLGKFLAMELLKYIILALMFVVGFTAQVVYFISHHTCIMVTTAYTYLAVKVGLNSGTPTQNDYNSFTKNSAASAEFTYGLEKNIKLPETSEEAMNRLLTCQGKDAYSILGLRSDVTDEEIKRYYRRQAVLVHPDKNQQPGAEEAFKILGQAFEVIGNSEKRTVYDRKIQEEKLSEDVIQKFSDLLGKFHEKMEEASLWMQCNNCGEKHRRYPTEKPVYSARKCNRCQCHHAAKEGDIWAETTFMGFKWHFYACMENKVYDVTPWISCQPNMIDKFQPNSHAVRMRMGLSSNGSNSQQQRPATAGAREAELENLLKNLFPQHNQGGTPNGKPSDKTNSHTGNSNDSSKSNGTACSKKAGKRRARRR